MVGGRLRSRSSHGIAPVSEARPLPQLPEQGGDPGTRRRPATAAQEPASAESLARAAAIAAAPGHTLLAALVARGGPCERQALDTALMDAWRESASVAAYTLLVELNHRTFVLVAQRMLRLAGGRGDPQDIAQDAFLSVYRYPTRFRADKPSAFKNWSYSILRNSVYRSLQRDSRDGVPAEMLADVLEDPSCPTPLARTSDAEAEQGCRRTYGLLLALYAQAYASSELKDRDRLALRLVEVQGLGYREAADSLGIRLENFKMVVCRARKKIHQYMIRVLGTRLP